MADAPKPSIFQKFIEMGNTMIDAQIMKAKTSILNTNLEDEFLYSKAITEDPNYSTHAQGWKDKPYRIQNSHLKQMSTQDSIVAAVIQTRQNQAGNHAKLVKSRQEKGFMIELRDEDALLQKIKDQLSEEIDTQKEQDEADKAAATSQEGQLPAEGDAPVLEAPTDVQKAEGDDTSLEGVGDLNPEDNKIPDDEVELDNWELTRKAKEKLETQFEAAKKKVEDYLLNCGLTDNRTFDSKKWNFEAAIRAWIRDSLTYDLYATEIVPDRAGRPHHWFPVDGGTIKYSSASLKNYKDLGETFLNMDILYPENNEVAAEKQKIIELKPDLLEKDQYKYVQVIRGKVERAYTPDELKVGIRNVTTDIFNNGYGISELELLVSLVTGHLNAEYYNQAYFTQGFSAKGILHIKASINRRKLESVRQQWQHMIRGARNSFQTPIFAGVEDVKWIPLTQNHNDIGFEGWMRYLTTLICAIYQIDPAEIGIHMKQEGGSSGLNGDNTQEKLSQSKDKGLYPLMRHLENFVNENIIKPFDARFVIRFTGLADETMKQTIDRQKEEVKFKKTVNEIRAEDGLPPLPGMDDVILDPNYMTWYASFSPKGMKKAKEMQDQQMEQHKATLESKAQGQPGDEEKPPIEGPDVYNDATTLATQPQTIPENVQKSKKLSVEIYKIEK